ncbi:sporulation integral membrane protein YtvI [Paenibacillaceae bacterium]|nr:sporulation integral membrane protein YtvI [Paenibacillaceae bacterium]
MSGKALLTIAVGLALIYLLFTVGAPFLLALIVALFLEPFTLLLMRTLQLKRVAAATLSSTMFTMLVFGLMSVLGVKIVAELVEFWDKVPLYVGGANDYVQNATANLELYYSSLSPETAAQLQSWIASSANALTGMIGSISTMFVNFARGIPGFFIFFIVFFVAVYMFSYSLNTLKATFLSFFEEKSRTQVDTVLQNLRSSIFGFLRSQIILSMMTYVITLAGLLVLGIQYPLAIALLIVLVDILPILGTGSVLLPWALYLLLVGDMFTGFGLVVLFLVITVFRRIIEPKVLADSIGIGALPALISLYVGFKLIGVIGVFVGPLVVIIFMASRQAGLFQTKIKL